ncbi:DUF4105 domain-containing protein [Flavobacterium sp. ASW18X]|uniref:lipoprotein N-acyltransferase Lnb domain-containing protein n=1 Tax=Flavobacterium sp. ASW18X TaxID=2572595 RepID=UPI0010AEACCD|nr:DUF4105 domain-containing protein [Flavobacterium sp. ASW18X]TKD62422.1 DUF4105 domain-containing protein [Flavobacterium sp. ASW18X]
MKRTFYLLILLCLLSFKWTFAQQITLSDKATISVMTCGAGDVLYYSFGHSAFRVQDPAQGIDVIYNYGTFDFNRPNFYLNFTKGKLIYSLSRRSFDRFLYEYELDRRWVKEQILNLTPKETNEMFQFFEQNYLPENREYLYDPLFNNCSSITGVVLKNQFGSRITFKDHHLTEQKTFRNLVHEFIPINSWGAFGIDLAFGGITDRKASAVEQMFLPYYAHEQLKNTTIDDQPIVKRERTVLEYPEVKKGSIFITTPLFWFLILLGLVIAITYLDRKHGFRSKILDFSLFFLSGIAGCFILLLWLATDHEVTRFNLNFIWLLPFNTYMAFIVSKSTGFPKWLKTYLLVALGGIVIIILLWTFGIHAISPLNLFLMAALSIRYLFLYNKIK